MTEDSPSNAQQKRSPAFWLALVGLTLLAAGMRLFQLGNSGLWVDELLSLQRICGDELELDSRLLGYLPILLGLEAMGVATQSLSALQPEAWRAGGVTEFTARIGPAVVGLLSIPALMLAARPMIGNRAAVLFGLLLAVSPWHLYWSQNARFYTPMLLFSMLSFFWYYTATQRRSNRWMLLSMIALGAAFWCHPTAVFIAVAMAGDWVVGLIRRKRVWVGWVGWSVVALGAAFMAVWMRNFLVGSGYETMSAQGSSYSQAALILGFTFKALPAVMFVAVIGAWLSIRAGGRMGWTLTLGAAVPLALLLIASPFSYAHFRYAFVAIGPVLALAAVALDHWGVAIQRHLGRITAWGPAALVTIACLLSCFYYYRGGEGFRLRWDDAFAYVNKHAGEGDGLWSDYPLGAKYYLQTDKIRLIGPFMERFPVDEGKAWFVVMSRTSSSRSRKEPLIATHAELAAYFDTRIEEPYSSVRVYQYDPAPAESEAEAVNP